MVPVLVAGRQEDPRGWPRGSVRQRHVRDPVRHARPRDLPSGNFVRAIEAAIPPLRRESQACRAFASVLSSS